MLFPSQFAVPGVPANTGRANTHAAPTFTVVLWTTYDRRAPISGQRGRRTLPRSAFGFSADESRFLSPNPSRAGVDPCSAKTSIVIGPADDRGVSIPRERNRSSLL